MRRSGEVEEVEVVAARVDIAIAHRYSPHVIAAHAGRDTSSEIARARTNGAGREAARAVSDKCNRAGERYAEIIVDTARGGRASAQRPVDVHTALGGCARGRRDVRVLVAYSDAQRVSQGANCGRAIRQRTVYGVNGAIGNRWRIVDVGYVRIPSVYGHMVGSVEIAARPHAP